MNFSGRFRQHRGAWLIAGCAITLAVLACERAPKVYVPIQATAKEQYVYAVQYRDQHELVLRNHEKPKEWKRAHAAVWESFSKVVELYPEDREVTPLARLELADMKAGFDYSGRTPSKEELKWSIEQLRGLQRDYPHYDFIQAKARFDEALCWKTMERYDMSQPLFKEVIDTYSTHKDPTIQGIVDRAKVFYQRVYVK